MSQDFYLTLPSNSNLQEFSNNANNSFKVRLPRPLRLEAGNWKVALASISMPDPKNTLPIWLDENTPLIYTLWYHIKKQDLSDRTEFQASFLLKDINTHVDMKMITGHVFMKSAVDYLSKKQLERDLVPAQMTGTTTKDFHISFIVGETDVTIDTTKVELHDFGRSYNAPFGWMSPSIFIHKDLALEMGWFVENPSQSDPQFALNLGPNLSIKLHNKTIPNTWDIKTQWTSTGHRIAALYPLTFWFVPRESDRSLSKYTRLSLAVNWQFSNLNYSFKHVFGPNSRTLYVYSDLGQSSVLGDQVTDFIRSVNYKREGKGSYYFEPLHHQYIPLRKQTLDIIEVQVSEATGSLVQFGQGVTD